MDFLISACSDIGIRKTSNQDSVLLEVAATDIGKVAICVICDGMGGLSKGEVASAEVIKAFTQWFHTRLPELLAQGKLDERFRAEWEEIIVEQNKRISDYSRRNGIAMGTTLVAVLMFGNKYYAVNVGDSRLYKLDNKLTQISKDQSYIQREIDMGRMTVEESKYSPKRNVLLQCVGASPVVVPDYFTGDTADGDVFMLCSDGFRHVITQEEIYDNFMPSVLTNEKIMREKAKLLVDINKQRMEKDNISVALVKVIAGRDS